MIYLALETVLNGNSVLIFCPTKKEVETTALKIAKQFYNIGNPGGTVSKKFAEFSQKMRGELNSTHIEEVLEQLRQCPGGLEKDLGKTVSFGVGFHHAGNGFRDKHIYEHGSYNYFCPSLS